MSNPVFECYSFDGKLLSTYSDFASAQIAWEKLGNVFEIRCRSSNPYLTANLDTIEQIQIYKQNLYDYMDTQHEDYWSSHLQKSIIEKKDAINPSHYKAYIETEKEVLQWLEAMQYLPRFRNPECFKAAVELQSRKYLDRNGGKDAELQELQKGLWYFKFLVAYIKNGDKPIRVENIDKILNG